MDQGPGILRSAYRQAVPVFIPAFTDSEIGLDISIWAIHNAIMASGKASESLSPSEIFAEAAPFNPFLDLQHYAQLVASHSRWGIFTIDGGVPRNWAQQIGPYVDIANVRLGIQIPPPRFQYGVQICPEPVHWGGLSGCTYSKGISWGKFVPVEDGGRYAEVYADATLAWPLLMKAVFEELQERPRGRR